MGKDSIIQSKYHQGSLWRRWDLHVHTPESKLGDSFSGVEWENYLTSLDNALIEHKIAVLGITDYMTIDGYEKIFSTRNDSSDKRLKSVDLIIPNIELRSQPMTETGKALNIHLLIDPSDPQHIDKIKQSLRQLRVEYSGQTYGCIRDELIAFAKAQNPSIKDDEAYKLGISQFKPSYEKVNDWLSKDKWISTNSLFGVANGKDGISGLPPDGFSSVRDAILKKCHFVFSGNPNDRMYYLGKSKNKPASEIIRMYSSLKPCLHGSDAHNLESFFKPQDYRYCWIKSDPTFEGLRQVVWEPDSRVSIGPTKPQPSDRSRIIDHVKITNNNGWFDREIISLNSGLVGVIGEKGAGKTALADLIAFAAGVPLDLDSKSSFITKGRLHLNDTEVELVWGEGASTIGRLLNDHHKVQRPLVRYLSQDFVERLCSNDNEGKELQQAIEEVVFSRLDEIHKEGFSSFEELRKSKETATESEKDTLRGELASLNREIERLYLAIGLRSSKEALKKQSELQVLELTKQLPSAENGADQEVLKILEESNKQKTDFEKRIAKEAREKRTIEDTLKVYQKIKEKTLSDIKSIIENGSLVDSIKFLLPKLFPIWDEKIESELHKIILNQDKKISDLKGGEKSSEGSTQSNLYQITVEIKNLQDKLSKDEINKNIIIELQKQISSQESTVQRLTKEIEEIDTKTKNLLDSKLKERVKIYLNYFATLSQEKLGLQELYKPIKYQLNIEGSDMKFELSASFHVGIKEWMDKSSRFYDGRKPQAILRKDEIDKYVLENLSIAWKSGDLEEIKSKFEKFVDLINPIEFMEEMASPSLKMIDLFDWVYSLDHVKTTYSIKYGGTELENLSPGTRGIALLVLYLLMDEDDRRPLIIDQPEGNLDNASVYKQLVPYIRLAKEKRQIILVTHNPNLIVATDAEQIIIASSKKTLSQSYPQIQYISGSIEHSESSNSGIGIRQAACSLLEGGDKAFKDREERYSISS